MQVSKEGKRKQSDTLFLKKFRKDADGKSAAKSSANAKSVTTGSTRAPQKQEYDQVATDGAQSSSLGDIEASDTVKTADSDLSVSVIDNHIEQFKKSVETADISEGSLSGTAKTCLDETSLDGAVGRSNPKNVSKIFDGGNKMGNCQEEDGTTNCRDVQSSSCGEIEPTATVAIPVSDLKEGTMVNQVEISKESSGEVDIFYDFPSETVKTCIVEATLEGMVGISNPTKGSKTLLSTNETDDSKDGDDVTTNHSAINDDVQSSPCSEIEPTHIIDTEDSDLSEGMNVSTIFLGTNETDDYKEVDDIATDCPAMEDDGVELSSGAHTRQNHPSLIVVWLLTVLLALGVKSPAF
jgi:hypothetical protein